jgi:Ca2+-binding EF-hand superfamily protein
MARPTLSSKPVAVQQQQHEQPQEQAQQETDMMLTREFTEQEILEFKDAFAIFDIDGNGSIETHELKAVISELGGEEPTDEEIQEMIVMVDANGDGEIDFDE